MPSTDLSAPRQALGFARKHLTLDVVSVIALVVAALAGPRMLFGPCVTVETVIRQGFVQSVVASGRVETPHRADVGVQITGTVRRVPVVDGQRADEPTGNLDTVSTDAVFGLLRLVNRDQGTTVLFVTHNPLLAARCDRTIDVIDGRVVARATA